MALDMNKYTNERAVVDALWLYTDYIPESDIADKFEEAMKSYFRARRHEPLKEVDLHLFFERVCCYVFSLTEYTPDIEDWFLSADALGDFIVDVSKRPWFQYWFAKKFYDDVSYDMDVLWMVYELRRSIAYLKKEDKEMLKEHIKLLLRGWARLGEVCGKDDNYYIYDGVD